MGSHLGRFFQLAYNAAGIGMDALLEFHQRRADLEPLADLGQQLADMTGIRRWHLDHSLISFYCDQRLIGHHMIALGDMPGDDFRLLQAFAQIGQMKYWHDLSQEYAKTSRAAARIRAVEGR